MSFIPKIYLVAPVRTPIGKLNGLLSSFSAVQLGVAAAKDAIRRAGIRPSDVNLSIFGNARQAGNGPNLARQIALGAGVPEDKPAYTVNMACASGLQAILCAVNEIVAGNAELVLAGGTESMTHVPYLLPKLREGYRLGHALVFDANYQDGFMCPLCKELMGETAERLAKEYNISRKEQDTYAVQSQNRFQEAKKLGYFKEEIVPLSEHIVEDEHPRTGVTLESLAKLPPVFDPKGSVHAGNSSGVTDGGAALLVASEKATDSLRLKPLGEVMGSLSIGVDPARMGLGPVPSIKRLLEKTKLSLSDISLIELNEAFAAQVLACQKELGLELDKVNVNGGAIALGHPIGASGARIVVSLLHEMKRRNVERGLATLCVSGGLGVSLLLKRV